MAHNCEDPQIRGRFRCAVVVGNRTSDVINVRRDVYTTEFGFDLAGESAHSDLDSRSFHLLATNSAHECVGSLRFTDVCGRPFEIEDFVDIRPYLLPNRHPAEITRFCIAAPYRRLTSTGSVHLVVLERVLQLSRSLGVTDLIASTREYLRPFYEYLLFDTHEEVQYSHPAIGNEVHTLMKLDLTTIDERYKSLRPALYRVVAELSQSSGSR